MSKPYLRKSDSAIDPATPADARAASTQRVLHTPAGAAPVTLPKGVPNSVFALAGTGPSPTQTSAPFPRTSAKGKRGGERALIPIIDPSTLVVETGVPLPPRLLAARGRSKWAPIVALLPKAGTSVALPVAMKPALYAYVKKASKAGVLQGTFAVLRDEKNATKCRLHRTA